MLPKNHRPPKKLARPLKNQQLEDVFPIEKSSLFRGHVSFPGLDMIEVVLCFIEG